MAFCRVCRETKGVYEFPDDVAGEADICIACAHDHADRQKTARESAMKAARQSATKARAKAALKRSPNTSGVSAARLQNALDRLRTVEAKIVARQQAKSPPATAPGPPPPGRNAPIPQLLPVGNGARDDRLSQAIAQELTDALQSIEAMRQQLEREVRAKLEAEFAAARGPEVVGFRVIAFDAQDRPLAYGRVRSTLDAVETTLRDHGFPPLATAWSAWLNGAWITAKPSVADEIVEALEKADIPGVEVFSGYPEDFFLNAVPL